jgi:2Fe-2S ferredoxin
MNTEVVAEDVSVTFILNDGTSETIQAAVGASLMHAAVTQGIEGIEAECGGTLACGTCHVYVEARVPGMPSHAEEEMLSFLAGERRPNSRLSCQMILCAADEGLILRVPAEQG